METSIRKNFIETTSYYCQITLMIIFIDLFLKNYVNNSGKKSNTPLVV